MALVAAVDPSTDPFQGLTGYKRDINGRPTAINGQQPAFRGRPNKPGSEVQAPPIRSSSNKPDRKSNITVPYMRTVPVDELHDAGRMSPGDVVFVSAGPRSYTQAGKRAKAGGGGSEEGYGPYVPDYFGAVSLPTPAYSSRTPNGYMMKVVGLDWINRWLGNGRGKLADLTHATDPSRWTTHNVLVGSDRVGDEWRSVPFLQEWVVDGVVQSNDQPHSYHGSGHESRQAVDFNIIIQGPAPVNNGYEDHAGAGALTQPSFDYANGQGSGPGSQGTRDTVRARAGPQYAQYPLQMFDRKPRPMMDVYIGLVATAHYGEASELIASRGITDEALKQKIRDSPTVFDPGYLLKRFSSSGYGSMSLKEMAVKAEQELRHKNGKPGGSMPPAGVGAIADMKVIHTFRFEYFSSRQLESMDPRMQDHPDSMPPGKRQRHEGWRWEKISAWLATRKAYEKQLERVAAWLEANSYEADGTTPTGKTEADYWAAHPNESKLEAPPDERPELQFGRELRHMDGDRDPFIGPSTRDFRGMVGAWRIGKVLDTKAFKHDGGWSGSMPDAGYKLTVNVCLEWEDWRTLRRKYCAHKTPPVDNLKLQQNNALGAAFRAETEAISEVASAASQANDAAAAVAAAKAIYISRVAAFDNLVASVDASFDPDNVYGIFYSELSTGDVAKTIKKVSGLVGGPGIVAVAAFARYSAEEAVGRAEAAGYKADADASSVASAAASVEPQLSSDEPPLYRYKKIESAILNARKSMKEDEKKLLAWQLRDDYVDMWKRAPQVGEMHLGSPRWGVFDDDCRVQYWPTRYDPGFGLVSDYREKLDGDASGGWFPGFFDDESDGGKRKRREDKDSAQNNPNIPLNPTHGVSDRGVGLGLGQNGYHMPNGYSSHILKTWYGHPRVPDVTEDEQKAEYVDRNLTANMKRKHVVWPGGGWPSYNRNDLSGYPMYDPSIGKPLFVAEVEPGGVVLPGRVGEAGSREFYKDAPMYAEALQDELEVLMEGSEEGGARESIARGLHHVVMSEPETALYYLGRSAGRPRLGGDGSGGDGGSGGGGPRNESDEDSGAGVFSPEKSVAPAAAAPEAAAPEASVAAAPAEAAPAAAASVAAAAAPDGFEVISPPSDNSTSPVEVSALSAPEPVSVAAAAAGAAASQRAAAPPRGVPLSRRTPTGSAAVDNVFSTIFGGDGGASSSTFQPLCAAHHSAGPAGSSASRPRPPQRSETESSTPSGRSFPRRKRND